MVSDLALIQLPFNRNLVLPLNDICIPVKETLSITRRRTDSRCSVADTEGMLSYLLTELNIFRSGPTLVNTFFYHMANLTLFIVDSEGIIMPIIASYDRLRSKLYFSCCLLSMYSFKSKFRSIRVTRNRFKSHFPGPSVSLAGPYGVLPPRSRFLELFRF